MSAKSTFRPRARLMLLLGNQLIRDAGIAVFELVKNAYDADATLCNVTLADVTRDAEAGSIVVEDDGHGMDVETVHNVWLEPGTEHRRKQREKGDRSELFERLPLGEKGVGRFAAHKLGHLVTLVTRSSGADEVVVHIDWHDFKANRYLSDVPVRVVTREPQVFLGQRTGTRIEIAGLRDLPWTRRRVRELHRAVSSICSPFGGPDTFQPQLILKPDNGWLKGLLKRSDVLKQAIFTFVGTLAGDELAYTYKFRPGTKLGRVTPRQNTLTETIRSEEIDDDTGRTKERVVDFTPHNIGEVNVEFYVFDRDPSVLKLTATDIQGLKNYLDQNGGVRVYRDGVRVYDYGEPGNDWLDLGGRRINVPAKRIGNNQIVGVVRLDLNKSQGLVEKTNREGFVENEAYRALHDGVRFAIKQAEVERNQDKIRIRRAYNKGKNKEPVLHDLGQLREQIKSRQLEDDLGPYLDRIETQFREVMDKLLVAAGAGLSLAIVIHEVEKRIADLLSAVRAGEDQKQLLRRAKTLSDMVDGLTWLTRSSGATLVKASMLLQQAVFNWKFRYEHHEIMVVNGMELGDPDFSMRCKRRLVTAALMNLIDNSIYWLGTRATGRRLYLGTTYEPNGRPGIVIADNGPGFVDPPEYLVEPFVTRKPDGMGLGLHIADEIMKQHQGKLIFPDDGDITLPDHFTGAVLFMEFGAEK